MKIRQYGQRVVDRTKTTFVSFKRWMTSRTWRQWLRYTIVLTVSLFILFLSFVFSVRWGLFGALPTSEDLQSIQNPQASIVYGSDSSIIGKYFIENRTNVNYGDISPWVIRALVATEDVRYYDHRGIDWKAWGRVFFKTILLQDASAGGGSTISQQLAKNLFPRQKYQLISLPINKVREIWTARKIERTYTKNEILTLYLNTVSFGGTTFGINAASRKLFSTTANNLSVEDAALLIGMLKATSFYDPTDHVDRATNRRNVVLAQMDKFGFLDSLSTDSLKHLPLTLQYVDEAHDKGVATYFREHLRQEVAAILDSIVKADGVQLNLYTSGLNIYTTIDPYLQHMAEKAVIDQMKVLQPQFDKHWDRKRPWEQSKSFNQSVTNSQRYRSYKKRDLSDAQIDSLMSLPVKMKVYTAEGAKEVNMSPMDSIRHYWKIMHAGFLVADPHTSNILAWVGGINHSFFKYDHVLSKRQPGSTFKPLVYTRALQRGYYPCDYVENELVTYPEFKDWTPENSDNSYGGFYSLQGAVSHSINTIAVWLGTELGIDSLRDLAYQMGIESDLPAEPSISLGTGEVSLFEMIQLYSTLANKGKRKPLGYLSAITREDGTTLYSSPAKKATQVIPEWQALLMTHMLKNTIEKGTATRIRSTYRLPGNIAGKTGTTQSHADGWFMGYTPDLVAGAWVGAESPQVHFRTVNLGQGAHTALPIWAKFFQQLAKHGSYSDWATSQFDDLPVEWEGMLDCEDYIDDFDRLWYRNKDSLNQDGESVFDLEVQTNKKDRRQRRRRSRKSDESKVEAFFKNLFKKKN